MANVKISELTALTTPAAADSLVIVDESEASGEKTKYITHANYQTGVLSHATALPITIASTSQLSFKDGVVEPTTTNDIDLGNETGPLRFKDVNIAGVIRVDGIAQGIDVTAGLHTKILNIGDWNMDSTQYVSIAHGLTVSKIREVSGFVVSDDATLYLTIATGINQYQPYFEYITATYITIYRYTGSTYVDNSGWDSTSYNRGWVVVKYVD